MRLISLTPYDTGEDRRAPKVWKGSRCGRLVDVIGSIHSYKVCCSRSVCCTKIPRFFPRFTSTPRLLLNIMSSTQHKVRLDDDVLKSRLAEMEQQQVAVDDNSNFIETDVFIAGSGPIA